MHNQHPQGAPLPPAYGPGNPLSTGPFPPHHYPQGPMPPADDGWGKVGVLMVLVALAFAGGVAYFIATSESSEAETAAAEEAAAEVEVAAGEVAEGEAVAEGAAAESAEGEEGSGQETEAAVQDPQVIPDGGVAAGLIAAANAQDAGAPEAPADDSDAGPDPLRANGEVDRPTGLVSMSIESEPAGAEVIRKSDGVRLGVTPYRYEVESASGNIVFLLKLAGHRSMSLPMPADRDSERQVMLFPGSGGAPIPVAPAQTAMATPEPKKAPAEKKPETTVAPQKSPTPKKVAKPPRVKKPQARPKRPKKNPQPKKPRDTVDIGSQPIPLD